MNKYRITVSYAGTVFGTVECETPDESVPVISVEKLDPAPAAHAVPDHLRPADEGGVGPDAPPLKVEDDNPDGEIPGA